MALVDYSYKALKQFYGVENSKTDEEFKREFRNHFYYPNACQFCSKFGILVQKCRKCEVMFYCCDHHIITHWLDGHKSFCIVRSTLTGDKRYIFQGYDLSDLRTRINFIESAQELLKSRELELYEKNMFMFPKSCLYCYESDPELLKSCLECPCANFCIKHHGKQLFHKLNRSCQIFNHIYFLDKSRLVFNDVPLEDIVHRVPRNELYTELPKYMILFLEEFVVPHQPDFKFRDSEEVYTLVSTVFTRSLTLIYALRRLALTYQNNLLIHIISKGKTFVEDNFGEFEILLHWLPKLMKLRINFIGCEKPSKALNIHLCSHCKEKKTLTINFTKLGYKEYYKSKSFKLPDIIVAYNVDCRTHDTWADASKELTMLNIPIVLTAMSIPYLNAAARDCVTNPMYFTRIQKNPYVSLKVERFLNSFAYANRFISIHDPSLSPHICGVDNPIEPCNKCNDCKIRIAEKTDLKKFIEKEEALNNKLHEKIANYEDRIEELSYRQEMYHENLCETKSEIVKTYFNLAKRVSEVIHDLRLCEDTELDEDEENNGNDDNV